ncbi:putative autophagy-related protein 11 [Ricinus communis]|uniref:putative autophagy-related protein 11 n=1 Tax=Ricinus communis TaxID=3988 RepID=UPI00201B1145|nr:putative autophagy-related protein 11 [Ricinus communis]
MGRELSYTDEVVQDSEHSEPLATVQLESDNVGNAKHLEEDNASDIEGSHHHYNIVERTYVAQHEEVVGAVKISEPLVRVELENDEAVKHFGEDITNKVDGSQHQYNKKDEIVKQSAELSEPLAIPASTNANHLEKETLVAQDVENESTYDVQKNEVVVQDAEISGDLGRELLNIDENVVLLNINPRSDISEEEAGILESSSDVRHNNLEDFVGDPVDRICSNHSKIGVVVEKSKDDEALVCNLLERAMTISACQQHCTISASEEENGKDNSAASRAEIDKIQDGIFLKKHDGQGDDQEIDAAVPAGDAERLCIEALIVKEDTQAELLNRKVEVNPTMTLKECQSDPLSSTVIKPRSSEKPQKEKSRSHMKSRNSKLISKENDNQVEGNNCSTCLKIDCNSSSEIVTQEHVENILSGNRSINGDLVHKAKQKLDVSVSITADKLNDKTAELEVINMQKLEKKKRKKEHQVAKYIEDNCEIRHAHGDLLDEDVSEPPTQLAVRDMQKLEKEKKKKRKHQEVENMEDEFRNRQFLVSLVSDEQDPANVREVQTDEKSTENDISSGKIVLPLVADPAISNLENKMHVDGDSTLMEKRKSKKKNAESGVSMTDDKLNNIPISSKELEIENEQKREKKKRKREHKDAKSIEDGCTNRHVSLASKKPDPEDVSKVEICKKSSENGISSGKQVLPLDADSVVTNSEKKMYLEGDSIPKEKRKSKKKKVEGKVSKTYDKLKEIDASSKDLVVENMQKRVKKKKKRERKDVKSINGGCTNRQLVSSAAVLGEERSEEENVAAAKMKGISTEEQICSRTIVLALSACQPKNVTKRNKFVFCTK